jgi:hypothetical protein
MIPQLDVDVIREELKAIRMRRLEVFRKGAGRQSANEEPPVTDDLARKAAEIDIETIAPELRTEPPRNPNPAATPDDRVKELEEVFTDAHRVRPFGVAFSGGGIRSATFNLGVLQGLAELGLLKYADYLSTVSGGGYIGAWFHGVVRNQCDGDVRKAERVLAPKANPVPAAPEHDPISFLRKYSNYLAPKPGLFSADTWVIGSIWIRNVLLNQLILVPTLAAGVVALLLLGLVQQLPVALIGSFLLSGVQTLAALGALFVAIVIAGINLQAVKDRTLHPDAEPGAALPPHVRAAVRQSGVIAPLIFFTAVILACGGLEQWTLWGAVVLTAGILFLFLLFQITGGFVECYETTRKDASGRVPDSVTRWAIVHVGWMSTVCTAVTLGLLFNAWYWLPALPAPGAAPWVRLAFGPPLVSASLLAGAALLVGLMGVDYPDAAREWLARIATSLALIVTGWMALFAIGVFGPLGFAWILDHYALAGITAVGAWGITTVAGVLAGRSGRTDGKATGFGAPVVNALVSVAPTVFMIGYLFFISTLVHVSLGRVTGTASGDATIWQPQATPTVYDLRIESSAAAPQAMRVNVASTTVPSWLGPLLNPVARFEAGYWNVLQWRGATVAWLLVMFAGLIAVAASASWRININEFSLHHFYKNRLVRCYLGASAGRKRDPNRLTGFDPADDFALADVKPGDKYTGPYAIVNAALNLNAGSELAQQERKATSFVFTPGHCGYQPTLSKEDRKVSEQYQHVSDKARRMSNVAYRPTRGFTSPEGPYLGTTVAISGAAANPNSGSHTSGPMAFLLTVFDARLGWWLGNPRFEWASRRAGPDFAWLYLFSELFGQTTGRSVFVNVSDGGHFENLGLYELVRRRCRYIIVGDSEQDGGLTFEGLGGAIRKCRADFGVEISINPEPLRLKNGNSVAHCVVGTIRYPERETGAPAGLCEGPLGMGNREHARGWLLYLKSSITGDEPADVLEYRARNKEFPHQTTADQFFSESQFESYRRLGLHVVKDAFAGVRAPDESGNLDQMQAVFQYLALKWYAPLPVSDEAASRLADQYSHLVRMLGERPALSDIAADVLPRFRSSPGAASKADAALRSIGVAPAGTDVLPTESRIFWLEAIQLMQNVATEFRLDAASNRGNPRNAGWMNVFRRWASSRAFLEVWQSVEKDYNPVFRDFVEDLGATHADASWPDAL